MNESALEPRDRTFLEILRGLHPALVEHAPAAADIQTRVRELGVRLSLAEILLSLGWLPANVFTAAVQAAAQQRVGLVDRSSMRHLQVKPEEDEQVVQVAVNYRLLPEADRDRAYAVRDQIVACGIQPLLSKILADCTLLDVEVYEGLLHYLRQFQAQVQGGAALPFDEEDLAIGLCGMESAHLTKVQVERALKIKIRLRKAGIEKNLAEIAFEQGALDQVAARTLAQAASERLNPPREIRLELRRFAPAQIAALGVELQSNRLAGPSAMPKALEAQRRLAEAAFERPLAVILVDLGLANPDVGQTVRGRGAPAAPPLPSAASAARPADPARPAPPLASTVKLPAMASPSAPAAAPPLAPTIQAGRPPAIRAAAAPSRPEERPPAARGRGRRAGRSSGAGRPAPSSGMPVPVIIAGGIGLLLVLVLVLVVALGGSDAPIAVGGDGTPKTGSQPPTAGAGGETPDPAMDEATWRRDLAEVERAMAEGDLATASDLAGPLAARAAVKAEWKAEADSLVERVDNLTRFRKALCDAIDAKAPFRIEDGSWRNFEIQGAREDGIRVKKGSATKQSLMPWTIPPKGLAILALAIEVDKDAPLPTLHFLIQSALDVYVRRQAATLLEKEPGLEGQVRALTAAYLGADDPKDLVVEGGHVLTRAEKAAGKTFGEGPEGVGETPDPEPPLVEREEILQPDPEDTERAENERKGLVEYDGRWVTREERDRLENEADGLVQFEGRWMSPEEKEEIEREREGLVLRDGEWVRPDEDEKEKRGAAGLVLYKGEWMTPEDKRSRLDEERKARDGKVYFRGRWISVKEQSILEDIVQNPQPEDFRAVSAGRCKIAIPTSGKWQFNAGGSAASLPMGSALFSITKAGESGNLVSLSCSQFNFNSNYQASGRGWSETVGGDNPSGLLRVARRLYEEKKGGAIVRVNLKKDFFHKDMHAFWCHLDYRDGTTVKIYSVASNLKIATFGYVFIAEFAKGQYEVSGLGVDSMLKTFQLMNE